MGSIVDNPFFALPGRAGGQTGSGGTESADDLNLRATTHATPGNINLLAIPAGVSDYDKFMVMDGNAIKYRTGSELLSDVGGLGGSGSANKLPKFTGTNTLGDSLLSDNGSVLTYGGVIQTANGATATPSLTFASDPDTGMFRHSSNILGFSTGGLQRALLVSDSFRVVNGSAAIPAFTFINDNDIGMYRIGANRLGFATAGTFAVEITATQQVKVDVLTASQAVFTDAGKNLVSNAITGTGNVVMSASPTFSGTISATNANFNGVTKFGDGGSTDYSEFEADGTLVAKGAATTWEDANVDLSPLQSGGTAPGFTTVASTGVRVRSFADGEDVDGCLEIPHAYKLASDFTPHIHFIPVAAPTGTDQVKFELEYFILDEEGVASTSTTIDTGDIAVDTQWERITANFPTISHANLGGQLCFNFSRTTASGDAYAGEAGTLTFGLHVEQDMNGSRQITTK